MLTTFDESTWNKQNTNPGGDDGVFSDGTLFVLNSAMNPNKEVIFRDLYPSSLSDLPFTTQVNDIDYIECTATFRYRTFDII